MERKLKNEDADLPVYWFLTIAQQLFRLNNTYPLFVQVVFIRTTQYLVKALRHNCTYQCIINGNFPY